MWMPTETEAVEMYARYYAGRHKTTASQRARETAYSLQNRGDLKGHKIWNAVADTIDHLRQNKRQPSH